MGRTQNRFEKDQRIHDRALSGIGVDTWGVDFGLIGHDGQVLGNPYMYRDSRTDGVFDRTLAKLGREKIFDTTGIQFMQLNSLYQLIAMQETRSPALEAAETMLFMPDLFNYLFSGERKSEFSIATTSQMYDPQRRRVGDGHAERAWPADEDPSADRAQRNDHRTVEEPTSPRNAARKPRRSSRRPVTTPRSAVAAVPAQRSLPTMPGATSVPARGR